MVAYQKKQLSQLSFVTPDNIISSKKQYINKIQYIQKSALIIQPVKRQNHAHFSSKRPQKTCVKRLFLYFYLYFLYSVAVRKITVLYTFRRFFMLIWPVS